MLVNPYLYLHSSHSSRCVCVHARARVCVCVCVCVCVFACSICMTLTHSAVSVTICSFAAECKTAGSITAPAQGTWCPARCDQRKGRQEQSNGEIFLQTVPLYLHRTKRDTRCTSLTRPHTHTHTHPHTPTHTHTHTPTHTHTHNAHTHTPTPPPPTAMPTLQRGARPRGIKAPLSAASVSRTQGAGLR
jgi:hypothetical protein